MEKNPYSKEILMAVRRDTVPFIWVYFIGNRKGETHIR